MTENHSRNHSQNDFESSESNSAGPRKNPCASCPYRKNVPSGLWEADEYDKLPRYDGEIIDQVTAGATRVFSCHHGEGDVCAGWLGHRDPYDLLAVRMGISDGRITPECADYTTDVPLFTSGEEASQHGLQDIKSPSEDAQSAIQKIIKKRNLDH